MRITNTGSAPQYVQIFNEKGEVIGEKTVEPNTSIETDLLDMIENSN